MLSKELRKLLKKATAAPWEMRPSEHYRGLEKLMAPLDPVDDMDEAEWEPVLEYSAFSYKETEANWDLVGHLRNAAPELIRRSRRLEKIEALARRVADHRWGTVVSESYHYERIANMDALRAALEEK